MVYIKFNFDGVILNGILLAKYKYPHYECVNIKKKLLWFKINKYKQVKSNRHLYLIFIPWKHKEKELIQLDEKYIINKNRINNYKNWIHICKYKSISYDGTEYSPCILKVNDFFGYKFIYENNEFLCNQLLSNKYKNLSILYKNFPELLNEKSLNKEN